VDKVGTVRLGVSVVSRAWLVPLLLLFACNPPDVTTPRPPRVPWSPGGGGAGTEAQAGAGSTVAPPTSGTGGIGGVAGFGAGSGSGSGGAPPPVAGNGTSGIGGTAGAGGGLPMRTFDAGSDPNRNAVVPGKICERLAAIQCAGEAFCCLNPGRDVAACQQEIREQCDSEALADDIAADSVAAFDATRAQVVFTELERLASQCDPSIAAYAESFDGLRSMFAGTVAPNGDCRPSNPLNMTMAGAALASCTSPSTHACMPSLGAWNCAPHASAGGACFTDINCMPGLFCDNPNLSLGGADCIQRKAVGASCELDNECQSLFCRGRSCVAAEAQVAYCLAGL
jgi:hypothetical protein